MARGPFTGTPSADEGAFDRLKASIDPKWIEEALEATGTASVRKRRLPAEQVIWLVLGMALYRHRPIDELVNRLDLVLPGTGPVTVARSGVAQARARLGDEPMKWLFEKCSRKWGHESARKHAWRGLALYGVDGTTVRVPDSDENRSHFGSQGAGLARGISGYPLARLVTLMTLRSHILAGARFGPYDDERKYAAELWPELPSDSLAIVDRLFLSAGLLIGLRREGHNRHWLTRATARTKWTVKEKLGRDDALVEIEVHRSARAKDPFLPRQWMLRAIAYRRRGFRPQTLLTSLLDPEAYPAIRSKKPSGVAQELWGVGLAYNLVRLEMERVADEARVPPTRISFIMALRLIRDEWMWSSGASPGAIPKHLRRLREDIRRFVLPLRRPQRAFPRAVKLKMSN
jgi:Insertion element 4 transposase N-terminal